MSIMDVMPFSPLEHNKDFITVFGADWVQVVNPDSICFSYLDKGAGRDTLYCWNSLAVLVKY